MWARYAMIVVCSVAWATYTNIQWITTLSRADEVADILKDLGADEVYTRYSLDKRIGCACVLAYFPRALGWAFMDKIAEAVGTDRIDIGRDCVRVWL